MHLVHEGVEMHAPLLDDRHRFKKQVHQQRLATTDFPVEIGPLAMALPPQHAAEQTLAPLARRKLLRNAVQQ